MPAASPHLIKFYKNGPDYSFFLPWACLKCRKAFRTGHFVKRGYGKNIRKAHLCKTRPVSWVLLPTPLGSQSGSALAIGFTTHSSLTRSVPFPPCSRNCSQSVSLLITFFGRNPVEIFSLYLTCFFSTVLHINYSLCFKMLSSLGFRSIASFWGLPLFLYPRQAHYPHSALHHSVDFCSRIFSHLT